jgi:ABC-type Mn2+/Zn2+ transport system permease subunit
MIGVLLLIPPILAVLLFLTFASLLKKVQAGRDSHNETVIGAVLVFFFVFSVLFSMLMFGEETT